MSRLIPAASNIPPADYSEVFDQHFEYVRFLLQRLGVREENSEDAAHEVLIKFMEKGSLAKYDAGKLYERTNADGSKKVRTAPFKAMLRGFVCSYGLQERDKQENNDKRSMYIGLLGSGTYEEDAVLVNAIKCPDWAEGLCNELDAREEIRASRERLANIPWKVRGGRRGMTLADVWDAAVAAHEDTGACKRDEVGKILGISAGSAGVALKRMREALGR